MHTLVSTIRCILLVSLIGPLRDLRAQLLFPQPRRQIQTSIRGCLALKKPRRAQPISCLCYSSSWMHCLNVAPMLASVVSSRFHCDDETMAKIQY